MHNNRTNIIVHGKFIKLYSTPVYMVQCKTGRTKFIREILLKATHRIIRRQKRYLCNNTTKRGKQGSQEQHGNGRKSEYFAPMKKCPV